MEPWPWAAGVLPAVLGVGRPSSLFILRAEGVATLCGDRSHVTSRGIGGLTLHVRKLKCLRAALHTSDFLVCAFLGALRTPNTLVSPLS